MSALEDAAREWAVARRNAIDSKAERNRYQCDSESEPGNGLNACWREGNYGLKPRSEWCNECIQRQQHHDAYRSAARRKGAALRKLARLAEEAAS